MLLRSHAAMERALASHAFVCAGLLCWSCHGDKFPLAAPVSMHASKGEEGTLKKRNQDRDLTEGGGAMWLSTDFLSSVGCIGSRPGA